MTDLPSTGDIGLEDPFDLERFERAQAPDYDRALAELRRGRKETHWIWYILPQLRGLGQSPMSHTYGLTGLDEARAYLRHPILGPRLDACIDALLALETSDPRSVMDYPDDLKLHACATLFGRATDQGTSRFSRILDKFFDGKEDAGTLRLLGSGK